MKKQLVPLAEQTLSTWQRRYLYFTSAITGAAIMVVEILGAKMLAPYVGTSHFVWTAQIAVTLIALSVGYYVGGRLVDRSPKLERLYGSIVVAAAYLCLAVVVIEPVSFWCLQFSLPLGTLVASMFLFFLPLALLAMTGPFFIRVLTASVNDVGGNVGRLTAISTLGSVIGTILIGYVLIPLLPNSWTMYSTAALLLLVAAVFKLSWSRHNLAPTAIAIAVILGGGYAGVRSILYPEYVGAKELLRKNSHFGLLQVIDYTNSQDRLYLNDFLTQNTYDKESKKSYSMFTYMLHDLANAYTTNINHVLCIGLGVGIVPMDFARDGAKVDVIEINPDIVPVGREFFGLEPEKLNITFDDGRHFLNVSTNQYDAVVMDAFLGDSNPSHLMTREAFLAIRRVLKPEGALVINTFADFEPGKDYLAASLSKTLAAVFPSVLIHHKNRNALYVASPKSNLAIVREPDFSHVHPRCSGEVRDSFASLRQTEPLHGRVLTDDYNPVEFFDARNRESNRKGLSDGMRQLRGKPSLRRIDD